MLGFALCPCVPSTFRASRLTGKERPLQPVEVLAQQRALAALEDALALERAAAAVADQGAQHRAAELGQHQCGLGQAHVDVVVDGGGCFFGWRRWRRRRRCSGCKFNGCARVR